jgi:GNAT superfamily N-acetyltransferase
MPQPVAGEEWGNFRLCRRLPGWGIEGCCLAGVQIPSGFFRVTSSCLKKPRPQAGILHSVHLPCHLFIGVSNRIVAFARSQSLVLMDRTRFDAVAQMLGDTPFTVTPYFFLRRRECKAYVDDFAQPQIIVVVPQVPFADVYVSIRAPLGTAELQSLADFVSRLELGSGLFVPAELVQPIRVRRQVSLEAEGLCFTYRHIPDRFTEKSQNAPQFAGGRNGQVRRLSAADAKAIGELPSQAGFLYQNYRTPEALLAEGLAFGLFHKGRLVSLATSLALTPKHCAVGVYTLPRYRNRGYATGCVEAVFAATFAQGVRPLWRIGIRQKLAIYFAEKLGMEEIGTTGREVYLQVAPVC